MAQWFLLALAAMLGYGLQNFLYKIAANKDCNSLRVNTISTLTVASLSGILYISSKSDIGGIYFIILVLGNGLAYLFANICRIESFKVSPPRIAAPISSMYIALTPILAFFIFKERITLLQLIGLTLATFTITLLSKETDRKGTRKNMALGIIFAAAAAASTSFQNIIGKSAAITGDIASFMLFTYMFSSITSLLMQKTINKENPIKELIKDYEATRIGIISGFITFAAYYLLLKALSTGPAMIIIPITALGIIITNTLSEATNNGKLKKNTLLAIGTAIISLILLM